MCSNISDLVKKKGETQRGLAISKTHTAANFRIEYPWVRTDRHDTIESLLEIFPLEDGDVPCVDLDVC